MALSKGAGAELQKGKDKEKYIAFFLKILNNSENNGGVLILIYGFCIFAQQQHGC